jgi:hypothetical protein
MIGGKRNESVGMPNKALQRTGYRPPLIFSGKRSALLSWPFPPFFTGGFLQVLDGMLLVLQASGETHLSNFLRAGGNVRRGMYRRYAMAGITDRGRNVHADGGRWDVGGLWDPCVP